MPVEPGAAVTFTGTASDETRLRSVEVYLHNTTTGEALFADGSWAWNPSPAYHRVTPTNVDVATTTVWTAVLWCVGLTVVGWLRARVAYRRARV